MEVMGDTRGQASTTQVMKDEKGGNAVTREVEYPKRFKTLGGSLHWVAVRFFERQNWDIASS